MTEEQRKFCGKLILIVGPSGSGKGTVIEKLKFLHPSFVYPISYTTRLSRRKEKDGEVYHFVSRDEFKKMIERGDFLEYAVVHSNNHYGTSKKDILDALRNGKIVVREIDIQGFHSIQKIVPKENLVSIFMRASDLKDLKKRILMRGKMSDEELKRRMQSAMNEIAQASDCDYQVENKWGEIEKCVFEVEKIVLEAMRGLG